MRRRYLIAWVVGVVIIAIGRILGLYFFEQAKPRFNISRLGEPGQLEALVREFTLPGRLPVDVLLLWSLLVLLWWIRDQVRFSPALSSKARQFDYLLLWVVGGIVVVNWGLWILSNITSLEGDAPAQPVSLTATFEDDSSFSNAGSAATDPSPTLSAPDDLSATVALVAAWSAVTIIVLLLVGDGVKGGFY